MIISRQDKKNQLQILESIRVTNRPISKFNIDFCTESETHWRTTISIIEKFSATIKYLRLRAPDLGMSDFLEILSLVPNVERLVLISLGENRFIPNTIMSSDDDLNLQRLKALHLIDGSVEFSGVFNRLPAGVLTELRIENLNLDTLTDLFKRQVDIKRIILIDYRLSPPPLGNGFLDHLKLESLFLAHYHNGYKLSRILSKQNKLKSLQLAYNVAFDALLMTIIISQLTKLETFTINLSETSAAFINSIDKLTKWKDLTIQKYYTIQCFGSIWIPMTMPNCLIRKLATCAPNLQILRLRCPCNLNVIRSNFNFIKVLEKETHPTNGEDEYSNNNEDDCFNPKLLEFIVCDALPFQEHPFLMQIIANYPNLKKLVFNSSEPLSNTHFKMILNGLTKLVSLTFLGFANLTVDDFVLLKNHKNNLVFISLTKCNVRFTDEIKNQLSERFAEVNMNYFGLTLVGRR